MAWPMPDDAPVIKTFFPLRRSIVCSSDYSLHSLHPHQRRDYSRAAPGIFRLRKLDKGSYADHKAVSFLHFGVAARVTASSRRRKADPINKDDGVAIKGYDRGRVLHPKQAGKRVVGVHPSMDECDLVVRQRVGPRRVRAKSRKSTLPSTAAIARTASAGPHGADRPRSLDHRRRQALPELQ